MGRADGNPNAIFVVWTHCWLLGMYWVGWGGRDGLGSRPVRQDLGKTRAVLKNPNFSLSFFSCYGQPLRTASKDHQPTANRRRRRQPPPTTNCQPPPTANRQLPPTTNCYRQPPPSAKHCSILSLWFCVLPVLTMKDSAPVNVRFCWRYEPSSPPAPP